MEYNLSIKGFHGTPSKEKAEEILSKKKFISHHRDDHWLGQGIYFFREDPEQAMTWALSRGDAGQLATVISLNVEVKRECFLNLDTRTDLKRFKRFMKNAQKEVQGIAIEATSDKDEKHSLRCMIFDTYLPDSIKVIQKSFSLDETPVPFRNTLFQALDMEMLSGQLCVRDQDVIDQDTIAYYDSKRNNPSPIPKKKKKKKGPRGKNIIT